jgi:hypothetical protein
MKINLIKRENASDLVLILMVSALVCLLGTRFFLQLFGWPTISFGVWHIAHVNWGGILMVIGIILVLTTHGEKIRKAAALISGAGWGLFIDEVGKYITKNNDYWFQPAIIFIYISFILLYLVYRYFEKLQPQDPKTLLYAVINKLEDIAEGDLDVNEKNEIIKKLDKIIKTETDKNKKTFAADLKTFIQNQKANPVGKENIWHKLLGKTGYFSYNSIFKRKIVLTTLGVYSAGWALNKIQETIRIIANPQKLQLIQKFYDDYNFINRADIYMIAFKIMSDFLVAVLFLAGLYYIGTRRRKKGLRFYQLGLIVSIFLSSVFKFYFEQFSEVFVLFSSILLVVAISQLRKELSA